MAQLQSFANGHDTLTGDAGNDSDKFFSDGAQEGYVGMHAVVEIGKHEYEEAQRRNRNRPNYSFIKWRNRFFVFGEAALPYTRNLADLRRIGAAKFTRDYYGLRVVHAALQVYSGNVPAQLNFFGAHPPMNAHLKGELYKSVKGKFAVETFTGSHEIEFVSVDSDDEVTGGAMNIRLQDNGMTSTEAKKFKGGTVVFDLGGGTFDTVILDDDMIPVQGTYHSALAGITETVYNFKELFDEKYARNSTTGIPLQQVYKIFLNPDKLLTDWAGEPLDCYNLYEQASNGMLNQLYQIASSKLGNIELSAKQVIVTGGGGDLFFEELKEVLFPRFAASGRVYLAGQRGKTIYANALGLSKLVKAIQRFERQQEKKGR